MRPLSRSATLLRRDTSQARVNASGSWSMRKADQGLKSSAGRGGGTGGKIQVEGSGDRLGPPLTRHAAPGHSHCRAAAAMGLKRSVEENASAPPQGPPAAGAVIRARSLQRQPRGSRSSYPAESCWGTQVASDRLGLPTQRALRPWPSTIAADWNGSGQPGCGRRRRRQPLSCPVCLSLPAWGKGRRRRGCEALRALRRAALAHWARAPGLWPQGIRPIGPMPPR